MPPSCDDDNDIPASESRFISRCEGIEGDRGGRALWLPITTGLTANLSGYAEHFSCVGEWCRQAVRCETGVSGVGYCASRNVSRITRLVSQYTCQ
jgi:hypothetical protein